MDRDTRRNMGIGLFFLAFSILYLFGASGISTFSPFGNRGLDSRSIPQTIGILACVLSVLHMVLTRLKMKRRIAGDSSLQSDGGQACMDGAPANGGRKRGFLLFLSLLFLVLYSVLLQRLGFILSTILYLLATIILLTPREKVRRSLPLVAGFSVVVPVLIYIVFTKYLTLFLPKGILG